MAQEVMGTARCHSCGSEVEAGDAYCWWCGTPLKTGDGPEQVRGAAQLEREPLAAGSATAPALPVPGPMPVSQPTAGFPSGWVLGISAAWVLLGVIIFALLNSGYQRQLREIEGRLLQEQNQRYQAEAEVGRVRGELENQIGQLRAQLEQERQVAQREKKEAVGAALFRAAPLVFGPRSGSLRHNNENSLIETSLAGVSLRNFVAEVTFYNPYSFREKNWTYGFGFRDTGFNDQYRLVISSFFGRGRWELMLVRGNPNNPISEVGGDVGSLNLEAGAPNTVRLVADGDTGELYVNGWHIATLDLSGKLQAGDVWVGIGFYNNTEITGRVTRYENFVVRRLP